MRPERTLTIRRSGSDVGDLRVSLNGKPVKMVRAVTLYADAEDDSIRATLTFHVDVVDLIDTVETMVAEGES